MRRRRRGLAAWGLCIAAALLIVACSETDETASDEYANWQQRNDAFFATLDDSLRSNATVWKRIKVYNKDEKTEGLPTDYIYAKVVENGQGGDCPLFTDSVLACVRGRLLPTASQPEGFVFTQTYAGTFNWHTAGVTKIAVSTYSVDGVATAIQHMHRGERWRVYVPYSLGYGEKGSGTSVPAYSTLIYDLALVDFVPSGTMLPRWGARQR